MDGGSRRHRAVAKLSPHPQRDTLGDKTAPIVYPPLDAPDRALAKAIAPKTKGDEDKLMTGPRPAAGGGSGAVVERNGETHQTLLWGTGETHLEVTLERLHRKFGSTWRRSPADRLPGDRPREGPCHGPPRQADRGARQ